MICLDVKQSKSHPIAPKPVHSAPTWVEWTLNHTCNYTQLSPAAQLSLITPRSVLGGRALVESIVLPSGPHRGKRLVLMASLGKFFESAVHRAELDFHGTPAFNEWGAQK